MARAGGAGRRQSRKKSKPLVGIKLGVRDEAAGIVERGLQKDLLLAAAGTHDPGAEEHIGLPDLIGELSFVLFVRGSLVEHQLTCGEAASAQETIKGGGRKTGLMGLAVRG